ncbi:MAG: hypothetical protein H0W73_20000 [Bacteroidetes bacterium]|nr:hypothetical protein [Bacteroidota bacterium]
MLKQITLTIFLTVLTINLSYSQNCKEQTIEYLQGIWIAEGRQDTALVIINDQKLEFNFKGFRNWDDPKTINIKNQIPELPDSIYACKFVELVSAVDTLHYKILALTDSTMILTKYSISKNSFFSEGEKPIKYIDKVTFHYRKTKGLPKGYNLRASVFGTWYDEATKIILKPDSTFSITFTKSICFYSTCGKFKLNGTNFVLKDVRDKKWIIHPIDCDAPEVTIIKSDLKIKHLLFDENNEIHLYYNWLGLWLKESHMILTKMR